MLQKLRSNIVHNGEVYQISFQIVFFVRAIYLDLLTIVIEDYNRKFVDEFLIDHPDFGIYSELLKLKI